MDVESDNYKMKFAANKTRSQCVIWEVTALSVLVFLAIFAIVGRITDWSLFKDIEKINLQACGSKNSASESKTNMVLAQELFKLMLTAP